MLFFLNLATQRTRVSKGFLSGFLNFEFLTFTFGEFLCFKLSKFINYCGKLKNIVKRDINNSQKFVVFSTQEINFKFNNKFIKMFESIETKSDARNYFLAKLQRTKSEKNSVAVIFHFRSLNNRLNKLINLKL